MVVWIIYVYPFLWYILRAKAVAQLIGHLTLIYNDQEFDGLVSISVILVKFDTCIIEWVASFKSSLLLNNYLHGTQALQLILIGHYLQK